MRRTCRVYSQWIPPNAEDHALAHAIARMARQTSRIGAALSSAMCALMPVVIAVLVLTTPLGAQEDETELAKRAQNPVANLISVPFQHNFNFGVGTRDATVYVLNVQPVIPLTLTEDWNVIARIITPIINQPSLFEGADSAFGLGDLNPTFFLSPAEPGAVIWGVGPTFTLPTATDSQLGNGQWSMGPAAVGLTIRGPWVFGALVNQQWSFAGWGDRDVSQLLIQPFVNYNLPNGWYLSSVPIITANWEASRGNTWTVPVGGGAGKLFRLGRLPVNTQLQAFYNVERPQFAADWQLRFQLQFLFPK
jgi:hypothetical protein